MHLNSKAVQVHASPPPAHVVSVTYHKGQGLSSGACFTPAPPAHPTAPSLTLSPFSALFLENASPLPSEVSPNPHHARHIRGFSG